MVLCCKPPPDSPPPLLARCAVPRAQVPKQATTQDSRMSDRFVTISIDDGHVTDFKTAELLIKYGLRATFYIPATNPERPVMSLSQIRELSASFEIGAHTMSHLSLNSMPNSQARDEIVGGKQWLEHTIGRPAISFCYPQGKFNRSTPSLVKQSGFLGARTCYFNLHEFPQDPFLWGVSTHAYSHSKAIQLRHAVWEGNFPGVLNFVRIYKGTTDWQKHFLYALDHVERYGGIAHLYLHSWEIEELGQWDRLEAAFAAVSNRNGFRKLTNGELFQLWKGENERARN
jgi:peptidoglycan-N-acetylglucosamine deacetylase